MADNSKKIVLCVVGARPNFMKIAPVIRALNLSKTLRPYLVHTGQHYDADMKSSFFDQLGIPEPAVDLGVGSGTHAEQTAEVMKRFEPVLEKQKPAAVLVVGDVNSTIACALVAVKKMIPVVHVEAGLRSYDRSMPEEINRVLTDQISELLFTTESNARDNLIREGIDDQKIHFVGNVMIDTLFYQKQDAVPARTTIQALCDRAGRTTIQDYALLTLHRPSNVDVEKTLRRLLETVKTVSEKIAVVFPVHPRTKARIQEMGLNYLIDTPKILTTTPLGYLQILGLMIGAKIVLTDSGGIQEETTALGIPCVTLRENTERPITVEQGTNTVVGTDTQKIIQAVENVLAGKGKSGRIPQKWDGKAALRIVAVLEKVLS